MSAVREARYRYSTHSVSRLPTPDNTSSWMREAPVVSAERRELAQAIREQLATDEDVIRLGPTDAERAADALDGF